MELGEDVRTCIALPGIPVGTVGRVKEVGRLFVVVELPDGRVGYYARSQLAPAADLSARDQEAPLGIGGARVGRESHLCLLPSTRDELVRSVAGYLAAGLEAGETCVCVVPAGWDVPLGEAMAEEGAVLEEASESGRLAIRRTAEVYYRAPEFTARRQLQRTGEALASAAGGSEQGCRAVGYVRREFYGLDEWWEYEEQATRMLSECGVTAMCAYEPAGSRAGYRRRAEAMHPYVVKAGEVVRGGAPLA